LGEKNNMKHLIPISIILLLLATSFTGATEIIGEFIIDSNEVEVSNYISNSQTNSPNLNIISIKGGFGMSILIRNDGSADAFNVNLKIKVEGGFIVSNREKNFEITLISVNETIKIDFYVFGFGILKENLPRISITVSSLQDQVTEKTAIARIIGPFVKIIGINSNKGPYNGYTLYPIESSTKTYLINNSGEIVHSWNSNFIQGLAAILMENGNLLRCDLPRLNPTFFGGGITGRVEIFDWNSTLLWHFEYSNNKHCLHHGAEILPNGNILLIAWEYKTFEEAVSAGRNPELLFNNEIWPDHVIEIEPTGSSGGNIVWEWHVWDHLIQDFDASKDNYGTVKDHPELIDVNFVEAILYGDWNHINSVDYNEELDQILLSVRNFNEIWVIDHSTTTEEAAGHTGGNYGKGGDLLYRWGNPQSYKRGNETEQKLFRQHDAQWIDTDLPGEGNILIFNNGGFRPEGQYSSVDEIVPPIDENGNYIIESGQSWGPEELIWSYFAENPTDFYSSYLSSAQRLPNGNTLICDGPHGIFFEVNLEKEIVWEYINLLPDPLFNEVNSIYRYSPDYPGLKNLFI
jgi:hypothetical protein